MASGSRAASPPRASFEDLIDSHSASIPICGPRQIAMYLALDLTGCTLHEVGRVLRYSHNTVSRARMHISTLVATTSPTRARAKVHGTARFAA